MKYFQAISCLDQYNFCKKNYFFKPLLATKSKVNKIGHYRGGKNTQKYLTLPSSIPDSNQISTFTSDHASQRVR